MKWIYLIIGSIAGGISRYSLAGIISKNSDFRFPFGTLAVNLSGCLVIGLLNSLAEDKWALGINERVLLMTGFCGAYTTFSTLILESSNLIKEGELFWGLANIVVSFGAGCLFFWIGEVIGRTV